MGGLLGDEHTEIQNERERLKKKNDLKKMKTWIMRKKMKNKKVSLIIMRILKVKMKILECFKKRNNYRRMKNNTFQKMKIYKKISN